MIFCCCQRRLWWIWCGNGNTREFSSTLDSPVIPLFLNPSQMKNDTKWTFYFIFGCQSSNNSGHEPNICMSRTIVSLAPRPSERLPTQLCLHKWENVHCHYFVWHINSAYCIKLQTLCPVYVHCELFACIGNSLFTAVILLQQFFLSIEWAFQSQCLNFAIVSHFQGILCWLWFRTIVPDLLV